MDKKKNFFSNIKLIWVYNVAILLLIIFSLSSTLAWFTSKDNANKSIPLSGSVEVRAVGGSSATYPVISGSGNMVITLPFSYLIPGGPVGLRANAKILHSSSNSLLKATLMVDMNGKFIVMGAEEKAILNAIEMQIPNTWVKYDNHWYYKGGNTSESVVSNTIMLNVNSSAGDVFVNFLNTDFIFPSTITEIVSTVSVNITVVFEAIQAFIPNSSGVALPNTVANSQRLYNESALTKITTSNQIMHLDAINNTGTGVHSSSTTVWKDLSPKGDNMTITGLGGANGWVGKSLSNSSGLRGETIGVNDYSIYDKVGKNNLSISVTASASKIEEWSGIITLCETVVSNESYRGFNIALGKIYGISSLTDISGIYYVGAHKSNPIKDKKYNITITIDNVNSVIKFYINGYLITTWPNGITNTAVKKLKAFGFYVINSSVLDNSIDINNIMSYNKVLTDSEVLNNYYYSMSRYY